MGVRLYVGGGGGTLPVYRVQPDGSIERFGQERDDYPGDRCFSAALDPRGRPGLAAMDVMIDSGAFTDPPAKRLSPECALERQLRWERRTGELSGVPEWRAESLVSYDLLIDEVWVAGERHKRRWSVAQADRAIDVSVRAARYLAICRQAVTPRRLVLACQGVDAIQYRDCVVEVLRCAEPGDILGLGGWCILGRHKRLLGEFERTLRLCLPLIASAGIARVHLFGCLWPPACGCLLYEADQLGLAVSADGSKPLIDITRHNPKKAGVREPYWRDNVRHWIDLLAGLRETRFYRPATANRATRQMCMLEEA